MTFRIAIVQPISHRPGEDERNVADAVRAVERAASEGADFVCFPETYPGPWRMPATFDPTAALAEAALAYALSPGIQPLETMRILFSTASQPGSREAALTFADKNFQKVMERFPGFARPQFVTLFDGHCSADDVARADAYMQPKLKDLGGGELELAQTKERIALCFALKSAKGAEIGAVLAQ